MIPFVASWTLMMMAMMLPSAAPFILLYRKGASTPQTVRLIAGYILIWALAGLPAYFAMKDLPMSVGPGALALAGVYQLTPVKNACLRRCRSPADFLIQKWGTGAFRLGAEHGFWCFGCCWALMMVLVLVGAMGMAWVIGLAAVVAIEKLTRHGLVWARITGVAFIVTAIIMGVRLWSGASMGMS